MIITCIVHFFIDKQTLADIYNTHTHANSHKRAVMRDFFHNSCGMKTMLNAFRSTTLLKTTRREKSVFYVQEFNFKESKGEKMSIRVENKGMKTYETPLQCVFIPI